MATLTSNDEEIIRADADGEGLALQDKDLFREKDACLEKLARIRELATGEEEVSAKVEEARRTEMRQLGEGVVKIVGQYQEQPNLLDPHLEALMTPLLEIIARTAQRRKGYTHTSVYLCSSVLYHITAVRGYKPVCQLFPHKAADLEPALEMIEAYAVETTAQENWEARYVVVLWLAAILLTPFDLTTIDTKKELATSSSSILTRIVKIGSQYLREATRLREAAAFMLAKVFTRPDAMKDSAFAAFLTPRLSMDDVLADAGTLAAVNQTLKSGAKAAVADQLDALLEWVSGPRFADVTNVAVRKLRVAVTGRLGTSLLPARLAPWRYERGARSLLAGIQGAAAAPQPGTGEQQSSAVDDEDDEEDVPEALDAVLEILLEALRDNETVVRWSAAKGIGRVTMRLPKAFADQILDSILEMCFNARETDRPWHGGCLALAELIRRGLLLPPRLPDVMPVLTEALVYEQKTGGYQIGAHVRDAACYVVWALARAYDKNVMASHVRTLSAALLPVALFDREINCRRAAAAAVQEHVGRQGQFPDGIAIVTLADYFTLSVRRHAYLEVAPEVAKLGGESPYLQCLMRHLMDLKVVHSDRALRALSARALATLQPEGEGAADTVVEELLKNALSTSLQVRHGSVLALSELINMRPSCVSQEKRTEVRSLVPKIEKARLYRGRGGEVLREACCMLIARISASEWEFKPATAKRYQETLDECVRHFNPTVQVAAAHALRALALRFAKEGTPATGDAEPTLMDAVIPAYLAKLEQSDENVAARRGYCLALGALAPALGAHRAAVLATLEREATAFPSHPIADSLDDAETRQFAIISLVRIAEYGEIRAGVFLDACEDYSTDRRGDVGSWVREVALEALAFCLETGRPVDVQAALCMLLQHAAEKIDRCRARAAILLHRLAHAGSKSTAAMEPDWIFRRVCERDSYDGLDFTARTSAPICDALAKAPRGELIRKVFKPAPGEKVDFAEDADAVAAAGAVSQEEMKEEEAGDTAEVNGAQEEGLQDDVGISEARTLWGRVTETFWRVTPLADTAEYRDAVMRGLVISCGGLSLSVAREARKAVFVALAKSEAAIAESLIALIPAGVQPRVGVPALNTLAVLIQQSRWPTDRAMVAYDAAFRAVHGCKDLVQVKSSIPVVVGLLSTEYRKDAVLAAKCIAFNLQLLGHKFPNVRQTAGQALYLKLLELDDLTLKPAGAEDETSLDMDKLDAVCDLLAGTAWGGDNETVFAGRKTLYAELRVPEPKSMAAGARKVTQSRTTSAAAIMGASQGASDTAIAYAELLREAHG